MESRKLRCKQCNWQGATPTKRIEVKVQEPVKRRVVNNSTEEVTFEVVEGEFRDVWKEIHRLPEEGEEVRYKCPMCKATLREE